MADLRTLRLRLFLTQKQLAERIGVPYQTVQRWEAGDFRPRPAHLGKLAEAFDVSGAEIVEAVEETARGKEQAA